MGANGSHFFCSYFFKNGHSTQDARPGLVNMITNYGRSLRSLNGHDLRSWLMYGQPSIVNMLNTWIVNMLIVNVLIDSFIFLIFFIVILAINCYCLFINKNDMRSK